MTPACPEHRALVDAALEPHASDATLERYACEVPSCPACARELAVAVGAHPGAWRLRHAERPAAPRVARAVLVSVGSALAMLAAAAVAVVALTERPHPEPVTRAAPPVQVARPALPRSTPVPVAVAPSVARLRADVPPRAVTLARVSTPVTVAEAPSWPEPPWVDLRGDRPKAPGSSVSSVGLVLVGEEPWAVGDAVAFTVTASRESALVLCVQGPEVGPIWRGAVSAGRTPLARDGRAQRFAFGAPGRYRFAVVSGPAGGEAPACDDAPVHVVEVEVSP